MTHSEHRPTKVGIKAHELNAMHEADVHATNSFVKRNQEEMMTKAGRQPYCGPDMYHFNANMTNIGEKAQEFAKELTHDIDHEAFPVK